MTASKSIYDFLNQVSAGTAAPGISSGDEALLQQLGLLRILNADQYQQLTAAVANLAPEAASISQETMSESQLAAVLQREDQRSHSVLFHFKGQQKREAALQQEAQDRSSLASMEGDLAAKQRAYADLVAQKSLLDTLRPYGDRYIALTSLGAAQIRDLGVRLYRVADVEFSTYWQGMQTILRDLSGLADGGGRYEGSLASALAGTDPANLWAVAIGLARAQPDPTVGLPAFQQIYNELTAVSPNRENQLMSSEVLFALPARIVDVRPILVDLFGQVAHLGVPRDAALGVASILLVGARADGTYATDYLPQFLRITRSYESAALLSILNLPYDQVAQKFTSLRAMFAGWGYTPSEDVELSSAYLTLSDLPADGVSTKLGIIAKGMSAYLEYPLVAASVLASLATLEANEALNLLEQAYEIIGRRAMPMSQAGLICVAVRMLDGIRNELVGPLDTTAATAPRPPAGPAPYPRYFGYVPFVVVHSAYYSTFNGFEGAHPGHVHAVAGGFTG